MSTYVVQLEITVQDIDDDPNSWDWWSLINDSYLGVLGPEIGVNVVSVKPVSL